MALQKTNEAETFKAAIFYVSDCARALNNDFAPYISIMEYLLKLIE